MIENRNNSLFYCVMNDKGQVRVCFLLGFNLLSGKPSAQRQMTQQPLQ